jgi:hypothetical protein
MRVASRARGTADHCAGPQGYAPRTGNPLSRIDGAGQTFEPAIV